MKQKTCYCLLILFFAALPSIQAGTKEEIMRLQSDVLALQAQIREFEKSFNERTDGLKSLVVQLNDQVAKSTLILEKISASIENQASGVSATDQTLLKEVRTLTAKMDDASMSIAALAQQVNELKVQSKSLNQGGTPSATLSPEVLYNQAYLDFVQEKFDLAIKGFQEYLNNYPGGDQAAMALLYMGDAHHYQKMLPQAIAAYTRVINDYSNTDKMAPALLKRANAELEMKERESAIADFKNIIEKYPATPESEQAKTALQKLGVATTKPAKKPRR
jgi:tol-pal system protein YbgF